MQSFVSEKDSILETYTRPFERAIVDRSSLEDILTPMMKVLNAEITSAKSNLESCKEKTEIGEQITQLLTSADQMQAHFGFTLAMLETTTEEEVALLKEKYSSVQGKYQQVKSKEDLTVVPARYVSATLHSAIILELVRVMKKCFKKKSNGKVELVENEENSAWITILADRLEFFDSHYPLTLTTPKEDIFCLEKSSSIWQDLHKSVVYKETITESQVKAGFEPLFAKVNLLRILLKNYTQYKDLSLHKALYSHFKDLIYYGLQPAKSKAKALLCLVKPKVEEAFKPWRVAEHPLVCTYMGLGYPSIGQDELIYVPRLFPAITKESVMKEYQDNTFNKIQPMDLSKLIVPELPCSKSEMLEELFVQKESKIPVRILASENLHLRGKGLLRRLWDNTMGRFRRSEVQPPQSQDEQAIIINMHGGGFVALDSNTQKVYLTRWVKNMNLVHFSIDYRLAPESKYPDALDDVWQAYLWIINYAKTVLGIENQKVILTGDSAGGTLALALTLRLIKSGMPPPHGVVLVYPALSIDDSGSSPSQFLSLNDSMLPVSIIKLICKAYVEEGFRKSEDPLLSPVLASEELLAKMPPLRIIAGSEDPLGDDNWRFLSKLKKLDKDAQLILYENLPHGYLSHQDFEDYERFVKDTCDVIQELIAL